MNSYIFLNVVKKIQIQGKTFWNKCSNPQKSHMCDKVYIWNPCTCICENGEYIESIIGGSVVRDMMQLSLSRNLHTLVFARCQHECVISSQRHLWELSYAYKTTNLRGSKTNKGPFIGCKFLTRSRNLIILWKRTKLLSP